LENDEMTRQEIDVKIEATGDSVSVVVDIDGGEKETFHFEAPGMLTGCDLRDVLAACGIQADYEYEE
jgi:hypothetical protein